MARLALRVRGARQPGHAGALPPLLVLSDPARTPDLPALAAALPPGSGFIYRHFGAADRFGTARILSAIAQANGLVFLVSADPDLAAKCGADGIHWPERDLPMAARLRARGDARLFTAAAHSVRALQHARMAGVDAALVSPVFASDSPSATRPKGKWLACSLARNAGMPVYALGGINARTAPRLAGLGFAGIACVGAIRSAARTRT